jgi:hypothetical protein
MKIDIVNNLQYCDYKLPQYLLTPDISFLLLYLGVVTSFVFFRVIYVGNVYKYQVLLHMINPILSCDYISKFEFTGCDNIYQKIIF